MVPVVLLLPRVPVGMVYVNWRPAVEIVMRMRRALNAPTLYVRYLMAISAQLHSPHLPFASQRGIEVRAQERKLHPSLHLSSIYRRCAGKLVKCCGSG